MANDCPRDIPFIGLWVWKANTFLKVRCFLWQCLHRSVLVREVLTAKVINVSPLCPLCKDAAESIIHTLRDCPHAQVFWDSLLPPAHPNLFYNTNLEDWLHTNWASQQASICWGIIFPFGVWSLWLRLNKVVFKDNSIQKPLITETLAKASEFAFLGAHTKVRRPTTSVQVRWHPPSENWFRLNSNGSSMGNLGRVGGGGIIRDSNGDWVSGYARAIGHTASVTAELWAL